MSTRDVAPTGGEWDVFLSYSRSDAQRAGIVASALQQYGLRVFVDDVSVQDAASITATIANGLARSTVLLALYSYDYPKRRACQWELTYAFLCGQNEGDPRHRVLVLNPEPGTDHVQPVELRDARHWNWPESGEALEQLVSRVAAASRQPDHAMGHAKRTACPAGPTRWLPAPARAGSSRFTGRFAEQWRIHSALHRHRAPLVHRTGQGSGRAAVLCGMPGAGKSLLAQEYALSFHSAFPDGVFWFDLHAVQDSSPTSVMDAYAEQVSVVAHALAPDRTDGYAPSHEAGLQQTLSRLAVLLGAREASFLWVVDGLPDGLTEAQLHRVRAPHLLGSTLVTTRSRHYAGFAETIEVLPLPDADGYGLLTSVRPPEDPQEEVTAHALVRDLGSHPQALDLLAFHAASHGYARVRNQLHAPGADLLTSPGPGTSRTPLTATLLSRPLLGHGPSDDVLRLLALACPAPLSQSALESALATQPAYAPWDVSHLTGQALDTLLGTGALHRAGLKEQAWTVHPLLARAVRRHDSDLARQEDMRRALLQTLAAPLGLPAPHAPSAVAGAPGSAISHLPAPGPLERAAAFDLQVELVTRVGIQPLAEGDGSLREALTSLHTLFTAARDALHRVAGEAVVPIRLPGIATVLLNTHLRPYLTRWHTALQQHEAHRAPETSVIDHEQAWEHSDELRAGLQSLHAPLTEAAKDLASLCGTSLLDPTPLEH